MIRSACARCGQPFEGPELSDQQASCRFCAAAAPETSTLPPAPREEEATVPPADDPFQTVPPAGAVNDQPPEDDRAPPGYEVLAELGRGGMGVVYKARQVALNRVVALKMILSGAHAGADDLTRFRTEAEAIARLQHPGIVQVFEIGQHDGKPFFSLEFCPAGSLDRRLAGTPLEAREAARLVKTLAEAMQAAHRANVIHRDLKPANVLLSADGTPKVTDFGLAKKLDEAGQTQTGAVMGTPSYMAPEQAEGKKDIGPLVDVYALGAILYDCLTGRPPFKAATSFDTILQVVSEEPVSPARLNAKVPRDLETVCLKCLAKDPGKRYAGVQALAEDLGRFLAGEPIQARPVGALERSWRWCRRNPALAGALAAVAASLVAGITVASAFAVQADRERGKAEEKAEAEERAKNKARESENKARESEEKAKRQKAAAEAARDDLEKSNDRLVTSVARGLLRPLGLTSPRSYEHQVPLTDPEIEALWELGETKEDNLRFRFIEEAVRAPVTARQLRNRARLALQAAIGLDARRRARVDQILFDRLTTREVPEDLKIDLALGPLAVVGSSEKARQVTAFLTQIASRPLDPSFRYSLEQGLKAEAALLEAKDAKEVAVALLQAMTRTTSTSVQGSLAQGLAAVAARLEPKEAVATLARGMCSTLEVNNADVLARGLVDAAARLEPKDAKVVATTLLQVRSKMIGYFHSQEGIGRGLAAVAARLEQKDARELAATLQRAISKDAQGDHWRYPLMPLARGLAAAAARLEPEEATAVCAPVVATLAQAMTNEATDASTRDSLAEILAELAEHQEPEQAAAVLARALSKVKSPWELWCVAKSLAAVAKRLEPKEAAAVCGPAASTLAASVSKTTDGSQLVLLVEGLTAVAAHLEPKAAAATCSPAAATLTQSLGKTTAHLGYGERLGDILVALAERLEPKDATAFLTQTLSKPLYDSTKRALSESLAAVAARLEPMEAKKATAALLQAISQTTDPNELRWLVQGLAATAPRLGPHEAFATLLQVMDKTPNRDALASLARGVATAATCLEPKDAQKVAATLIEDLSKTGYNPRRESSVGGLVGLATRLEAKDAKEAAATLLQAMSKTSDPQTLCSQAEGLAAVAARLEAREAAALCARAAARLQLTITSTYPHSLIALARGLAAVAARLGPKEAREAAATLLRGMSKTPDSGALNSLALGLAAVAARLEAREAAALCARATTYIQPANTRKESTYFQEPPLIQGLVALVGNLEAKDAKVAAATLIQFTRRRGYFSAEAAEAWTAAAARLEPEDAKEVAATLLQAMSKELNYPEAFRQGLTPILTREAMSCRDQRPRSIAGTLGLATPLSFLAAAPAHLAPALEPQPEPLPSQMLVDLLKHPMCVGEGRRAVLDALGVRYKRTFSDQWDFVRFATERKLGLDFTTPPQRPR
jgi:hypothetical protein